MKYNLINFLVWLNDICDLHVYGYEDKRDHRQLKTHIKQYRINGSTKIQRIIDQFIGISSPNEQENIEKAENSTSLIQDEIKKIINFTVFISQNVNNLPKAIKRSKQFDLKIKTNLSVIILTLIDETIREHESTQHTVISIVNKLLKKYVENNFVLKLTFKDELKTLKEKIEKIVFEDNRVNNNQNRRKYSLNISALNKIIDHMYTDTYTQSSIRRVNIHEKVDTFINEENYHIFHDLEYSSKVQIKNSINAFISAAAIFSRWRKELSLAKSNDDKYFKLLCNIFYGLTGNDPTNENSYHHDDYRISIKNLTISTQRLLKGFREMHDNLKKDNKWSIFVTKRSAKGISEKEYLEYIDSLFEINYDINCWHTNEPQQFKVYLLFIDIIRFYFGNYNELNLFEFNGFNMFLDRSSLEVKLERERREFIEFDQSSISVDFIPSQKQIIEKNEFITLDDNSDCWRSFIVDTIKKKRSSDFISEQLTKAYFYNDYFHDYTDIKVISSCMIPDEHHIDLSEVYFDVNELKRLGADKLHGIAILNKNEKKELLNYYLTHGLVKIHPQTKNIIIMQFGNPSNTSELAKLHLIYLQTLGCLLMSINSVDENLKMLKNLFYYFAVYFINSRNFTHIDFKANPYNLNSYIKSLDNKKEFDSLLNENKKSNLKNVDVLYCNLPSKENIGFFNNYLNYLELLLAYDPKSKSSSSKKQSYITKKLYDYSVDEDISKYVCEDDLIFMLFHAISEKPSQHLVREEFSGLYHLDHSSFKNDNPDISSNLKIETNARIIERLITAISIKKYNTAINNLPITPDLLIINPLNKVEKILTIVIKPIIEYMYSLNLFKMNDYIKTAKIDYHPAMALIHYKLNDDKNTEYLLEYPILNSIYSSRIKDIINNAFRHKSAVEELMLIPTTQFNIVDFLKYPDTLIHMFYPGDMIYEQQEVYNNSSSLKVRLIPSITFYTTLLHPQHRIEIIDAIKRLKIKGLD